MEAAVYLPLSARLLQVAEPATVQAIRKLSVVPAFVPPVKITREDEVEQHDLDWFSSYE